MGTASLYGFQTDNGFVGQQYSWLGSVLPLGVSYTVAAVGYAAANTSHLATDRICYRILPRPSISTREVSMRRILTLVCFDAFACTMSELVRFHGSSILYGLHRGCHFPVIDDSRLELLHEEGTAPKER